MRRKMNIAVILKELKEKIRYYHDTDFPSKYALPQYLSSVLFRSIDYSEFILNDLKVFVAGFFFVNPIKKSVHALYEDEYYTFPYYWPDNKKDNPIIAEDLLNLLFTAWRSVETTRKKTKQKSYFAEYTAYIPYTIKDKEESNINIDRNEKSFKNFYDIHYCNHGEITFFIFSWRLFLRLAQNYSWNFRLQLHEQPLTYKGDRLHKAIWASDFWKETELLREKSIIKRIDEISNNDIYEKWLTVISDCGDNHIDDNTWVNELLIQNLIIKDKQNNYLTTKSFTALILYLKNLSNATNLDINIQHSFTRYELKDLDNSLKKACLSIWYKNTDNNATPLTLMNDLHKYSKFPVIPYFYWNSLNPKPKAHLVMPIWDSAKSPEIYTAVKSDLKFHKIEEYQVKVSTKGFLVLGISPLAHYDWTVRDDLQLKRFDDSRIRKIRDIYLEISKVIADDYYYNLAAKKEIELEKRIVEDMYIGLTKDYTHRMRNLHTSFLGLKHELKKNPDISSVLQNRDIESWLHTIEQFKYYIDFYEHLKSYGSHNSKFSLQKNLIDLIRNFEKVFNIKIESNISEFKKSIYLYGPTGLFHSILDELIYNANRAVRRLKKHKFIGIMISVKTNDTIEMRIRDNGPSINLALLNEKNNYKLKSVDDVFIRGISANPDTRSGFGLWRVKHVIVNHFNGNIKVNKNYTDGCEFIIKFHEAK